MMETDSINPIVLTLDEIIAIQSLKNKEKNEEMENGYQNHNREDLTEEDDVDRRLRDTPGFGSKPIHRRLGYNNHNIINGGICRNMKYKMAQKSIFKARHRFFRNLMKPQRMPVNPLITFSNPNAKTFVQPLTTRSVNKFNRMNNTSFFRNNSSSRSVVSTNFNHRHSIEKCLNPIVQEEIAKLTPSSNPINMVVLNSFRPVPEKTNMSTNERFSCYI